MALGPYSKWSRRCKGRDSLTGERCVTYLATDNAGPCCSIHTSAKPHPLSPEQVMRNYVAAAVGVGKSQTAQVA